MHPLPPAPVQTGLEVPQAAHIFLLPEITNPTLPDLGNQRPHIGICAAIVHNLDLHLVRTRILRKYAQYSLP